MDLKQLAILTLQVSVVSTVFGFGLQTTTGDLSYLIRRPGLLARSLLSMFVVMPAVAVLLARLFDFPQTVERALIILSISPMPPLLPVREIKAGGHAHYALGLMAVLALTAIVVVPLEILVLQAVSGRPLELAFGAVARVVVVSILLPLAAGMAVRAAAPGLVGWIEKPVALIAKVLLALGLVALLAAAGPAMWQLIGGGTLIAIILFLSVGFVVGHLLGGPDADHSVGTRPVHCLPASSRRLDNRGREFPGGALRRHDPALPAARRTCGFPLSRLAAAASANSAWTEQLKKLPPERRWV